MAILIAALVILVALGIGVGLNEWQEYRNPGTFVEPPLSQEIREWLKGPTTSWDSENY